MGKPKKTNRDRDRQLSNIEYALGMHSKQMQELFVLLAEYIEMRGDTNELTNFLTEKAEKQLKKAQADGSDGTTSNGVPKAN